MSDRPVRRYVVPGRVELVGKHVDYAGGRSLTCAVDRAITVEARPLDEPVIRVREASRRGSVEVALLPGVEPDEEVISLDEVPVTRIDLDTLGGGLKETQQLIEASGIG